MFNRKEQLKHSDFGVTKSNYRYTVFTIWFDSDLKSLHTKSIETKVKQSVNYYLTLSDVREFGFILSSTIIKANVKINI